MLFSAVIFKLKLKFSYIVYKTQRISNFCYCVPMNLCKNIYYTISIKNLTSGMGKKYKIKFLKRKKMSHITV